MNIYQDTLYIENEAFTNKKIIKGSHHKHIRYTKCIFKEEVKIVASMYLESITFELCFIDKQVFIENDCINFQITFDGCHIERTTFNEVEFEEEIILKSCFINRKNNDVIGLSIKNCDFQNKFEVSGTICNAEIFNCSFREQNVILSGIFQMYQHYSALLIQECYFHSHLFIFPQEITKSEKDTQVIQANISLENSVFHKRVDIIPQECEGELRFINSIVHSNIKFIKGNKQEGIEYNLKGGVFFGGTKFEGIISFVDLRLKSLKVIHCLGCHIQAGDSFLLDEANSATYRVLKKSALDLNSQDDYLKYKKKEYQALEKEKRKKLVESFKRKSFRIAWQNSIDVFILFLNKVSSKHGTSWSHSLVFLIITSYILFNLLIFFGDKNLSYSWSFEGFIYIYEKYANKFWLFFNPGHKITFLRDQLNLEINGYTGFIDTIARVCIIYGSFQFTMSFRKFNK
ncbi:hypothetical protein BKI52_28235 [marine bacterium AO1-C]|nr:hypothetical protein BKI52_28235 [marine bacterium AO1-C]